MLKKVTDFGVIFGALGKGITEKQNGCKILKMSWEMINVLQEREVISVEKVTEQSKKLPD